MICRGWEVVGMESNCFIDAGFLVIHSQPFTCLLDYLSVCMLSCLRLFATSWTVVHQAPLSMGFPGKHAGVSCHFLLQGIYPTQGTNWSLQRLLHWQEDSYYCTTREADCLRWVTESFWASVFLSIKHMKELPSDNYSKTMTYTWSALCK